MYPSTPDWTSGAGESAWFYDVARARVCQTEGWNFLATVEGDLVQLLSTSLPTFDGSSVDSSTVTIIDQTNPNAGVWSLDLLRALYAVAQRYGASQNYLQAIANDAGAQTISTNTLATAAWIERGHTVDSSGSYTLVGSPDDVRIPDGAVLPVWGVAPPQPAQLAVGFNCNTQIPPGTLASMQIVPFAVDAVLVLVVIGVVVVGASYMANRIPVRRISNPTQRKKRRHSRRVAAGRVGSFWL
jgi:hypothetical protein